MPRVTRRGNIGRPQFQACQSGRHIEAGLGLGTDRLQREGVVRSADQRIGADPDADRGAGGNAAANAATARTNSKTIDTRISDLH